MNMSNIENDIRRTSLRIDESLAAEVERLAEENERSFNNQLLILLRKGIKLVNAEEQMIDSSNLVGIIASDVKNPHNMEGGPREAVL
jgi:hypothetical protein